MARINTEQEITLLRSAVAGLIGKDKEGSYRPEFVREMYASLARTPNKHFTAPANFLDEVAKS